MEAVTKHINDYVITTDKEQMDVIQIHQWLSQEAYWSKGIPLAAVSNAFDNSFCIGILSGTEQVGYARLITDYTVFAYLADVYVKESHRGKGLSKAMLDILLNLEWVTKLRRLMLATTDAHGLYEQYGFHHIVKPEKLMEISRPAIYGDNNNPCV